MVRAGWRPEVGQVSGRERILGAIQGGLGRGELGATEQAALENVSVTGSEAPVPPASNLMRTRLPTYSFNMRKALISPSIASRPWKTFPTGSPDYLVRENLPANIRMAPDPSLAGIPWDKRPTLTVSEGKTDGTHEVGLTGTFAGVAETGTLIMRSGPEHPTTLNFLPDTHVVVLRKSQIVGSYEDAWDQIRESEMPRTVNFITGPSRTGDIEQTIFMGAHGPRRMHIVLVENE